VIAVVVVCTLPLGKPAKEINTSSSNLPLWFLVFDHSMIWLESSLGKRNISKE
jgi:hypothetical protein